MQMRRRQMGGVFKFAAARLLLLLLLMLDKASQSVRSTTLWLSAVRALERARRAGKAQIAANLHWRPGI